MLIVSQDDLVFLYCLFIEVYRLIYAFLFYNYESWSSYASPTLFLSRSYTTGSHTQ